MKKLLLAMTAAGVVIAPSVFGLTYVGAGCPTTRVVALHPTTVVGAPLGGVHVVGAPMVRTGFLGWNRSFYNRPLLGSRVVGYNTGVVGSPHLYKLAYVRTGFVNTGVVAVNPGFVRTSVVAPVATTSFSGHRPIIVDRPPIGLLTKSDYAVAVRGPDVLRLSCKGNLVTRQTVHLASYRELRHMDDGDRILTNPEAKFGGLRFLKVKDGKLHSLKPDQANLRAIDLNSKLMVTKSNNVYPLTKAGFEPRAGWGYGYYGW